MRLLALTALFLVSACAPQIVGGEAGGIIKNHGLEQGKEFNMAEAHCQKYGRHARMAGANVIDATQRFDCVS